MLCGFGWVPLRISGFKREEEEAGVIWYIIVKHMLMLDILLIKINTDVPVWLNSQLALKGLSSTRPFYKLKFTDEKVKMHTSDRPIINIRYIGR